MEITTKAFQKVRDNSQARYFRDLDNIRKSEVTFESYVEQFNACPIVILDEHDRSHLKMTYELDLDQMFHDACKEKGWVYIEVHAEYNRHILTVPRNKRTPKLVAGLLLLAGQHKSLTTITRPRSWQFSFKGDEGKALLEAWIEQCKTDVLYQIILGFGPDVTPDMVERDDDDSDD